VTDRRGGPLQPSAVIARNLTRELEVFIPVGILISVPAGSASGIQWGYLLVDRLAAVLPRADAFNRDRMRAGDLIAGTMVIALPRQRLLGDLVEVRARFVFADQQLKSYGARELQILEDLLRRPDTVESRELLGDVADRIYRKINWTEAVAPADTALFLRDFYTAQRAFLEREPTIQRPVKELRRGCVNRTPGDLLVSCSPNDARSDSHDNETNMAGGRPIVSLKIFTASRQRQQHR
jgi:hypothetical protein